MERVPLPIDDLTEWSKLRAQLEKKGATIGFVPTMGALHKGHKALLERSRRENEISVLSIYVNPTQFNDKSDLDKYPVTTAADLEVAQSAGVDFVLRPTYAQMYPDEYRYRVVENELSTQLEGAHRPGHFDGMLTVVLKLLNLVRADRAYFGEKDFQQLELVKGMARAFFLETQVIACPTVREVDGLAMSSRNVNLPPDARQIAPLLHRALNEATTPAEATKILQANGFQVDYVEDVGERRLAAARIGGVRLIDNVQK